MPEITIVTDNVFKDMQKRLERLNHKALPKANKRAINRSLIAIRKDSIKDIQKFYKLKRGDLVKSGNALGSAIALRKASGTSLGFMFGEVKFSNKPINMLKFVSGKKAPRDQKGVSPKRRRKIKVEVTPGQKKTKQLDFIQRGKNGKMFVFRRRKGTVKNGKEVLAAQKIPSLSVALQKLGRLRRIQATAAQKYARNLRSEIRFAINKELGT